MDVTAKLSGCFDDALAICNVITDAYKKNEGFELPESIFPFRRIAHELKENLFAFHYIECENAREWWFTNLGMNLLDVTTPYLKEFISGFFLGLFNTNNKRLSKMGDPKEKQLLIRQIEVEDYYTTILSPIVFTAENVRHGPDFSDKCFNIIQHSPDLLQIFRLAHGCDGRHEQDFDDTPNKVNEKVANVLLTFDDTDVYVVAGFILSMFVNQLTEINGKLYDLNDTLSIADNGTESCAILELRDGGILPPLITTS